ncbi:bacteriocin biosynthesis protein [Pseudoalteromonas rubra]|uniref:Bacteriocin biosynthesis protein n=1 Tax=Pseudoalteromonas rubra TaxID=43658 RepID=A0A5S3WMR6_9GAMM|nr:bacteriocin biosynthesis protein [Pseudoalteromonas rubra]TMP37182.1 bacteriocin biosynthesis protein [Pseudoalteromonas rubra]
MKLKFNGKFSIFTDKHDNVLLNSQTNEFVLDAENFPLFSHFKHLTSIDELAKKVPVELLAHFYYQVENATKRGWLVEEVDLQDTQPELIGEMYGSNCFIQSFTENWQRISPHLQNPCVLIEDIRKATHLQEHFPLRLCEVYKNSIYISPVLTCNDKLESYLAWVFANRPLDLFMDKFGKGKGRLLSFPKIPQQLCSLVNTLDCIEALVFDIQHGSSAKYNFDNLKRIPHSESTSELSLKSTPITYDADGGSRAYKAEDTLKKLAPFIGRQLGYIFPETKLSSPLDSIKIFTSGFYKCPMKAPKLISGADFAQQTLGKGVTHEQSKASALCEAIERKNAQYIGDEPSQVAQAQQLDVRSYDFEQLLPYSEQQYARFSDPNDSESQRKQAALRYTGEAVNWTALWSLTRDEKVYVPTVCCFANTPFEEDRFGKWHSNGCAAGNNLEEAILQALFELLERDATAIWWYNRLPRPQFELNGLDPDYLAPLHETITAEHDYWVLDLTVDTGVPVMAAIGRNKATQGYVFGFGCHLKPEMAAQRALTELCQLIPIRDQNGAPFDFDAITDDSFLLPNEQAPRGSYKLTQSGDLKDDILAIVEHLHSLDMETLVLDYSRSPIPLSTVKVFVPGLCHIWPQLGNPRFYQTPVKLGWQEEALTEQTINQQGLYI